MPIGPGPIYEFDTYIAPDGRSYNLHSPEVRWVLNKQGTGMPPIQYITQKGPFQHGETLLGYRLQSRLIQMVVRQNYNNRNQLNHGRLQILDVLRPNRQLVGQINPGVLRHTFSDGSKLDIKVIIEAGPNFEPSQADVWDEWSFTEVLRFRAHDPVFYNPSLHTNNFINTAGLIASLDQLVFPTTFPIRFTRVYGIPGAFTPDPNTITYDGSWIEYPRIVLVGPIGNPFVIINLTTDETIQLNYEVQPNETVTIDTAFGAKTITSSLMGNIIGYLDISSDFGTFHLEPGVNQFQTVVTGYNSSSAARLEYNDRYIGY